MISTQKNLVNVYGCGGAGSNILKRIEVTAEMADVRLCFVDTSMSNLRNAKVKEEDLFIFDGVDGSGKVRAENHELIAKQAKNILAKFVPTKFNIIVSSASGGSGSVISPTLASQIQATGERVVVVLIGSTSSQIEINNSIKTMMSFDSIAAREKAPIVMHYLENSEEHSRAEIDDAAVAAVKALLVLFSGQNDELDTADLRHWLAHKNLNNELVSLHFCSSQEGYASSGAVVSVATLARTHHNTTLKPLPAYQAVGYLTTPEEMSFIGDKPLHYAISGDLVTITHKRLSTQLKQVNDQLDAVVGRERLYAKDANITDNGIIL